MAEQLYKRGKTWYAWIFGERVSTGCKDKDAARLIARDLERRAADPEGAAKDQATLSDALNRLIEEVDSRANAKPPKAAHATVEFYRKEAGILMAVLAPEWDTEHPDRSKDLPLRAVTAATVDDYIAQRRKKGWKDNTIAKELTTWRKAMKLAKRAGTWDGEIDRVFPVAFAPAYKPRERALTAPEWLALLEDAEALDQPESRRPGVKVARVSVLAMVAFMVATSAEWVAVERARPEDVELEALRVHLRGTKDAQHGGHRDRVVPVMYLGHALLLDFAMRHADGLGVLLFRRKGNFRRDLATACERADIGRLSPNDLRRTHATWLRLAGVEPANIAPIMGHADSRMVERVYGRVKPVDLAPMVLATFTSAGGELNLYGAGGVSGHSRRPWQHRRTANNPIITGVSAVARDGIEPPTRGFSIPCSTN
jgi:integrase